MNCILIGLGQIGIAITKAFGETHDIDIYSLECESSDLKRDYDLMLVAMPYSSSFVDTMKEYQKWFNPKATIIFSTVAIGTTRQIPNAYHSPIEGRHPHLEESIYKMRRWVSYNCSNVGNSLELVQAFFKEAAITNTNFVCKTEFTEALKLMSTSLYGLNIEFARYRKEVANAIGMDYTLVKAFDEDYNELYKELGLEQFQRYILDPPEGNTGGHCIVPNSRILDKQFPSMFLKEIYRDKEEK